MEMIIGILAAVASMVAGGIASTDFFRRLFRKLLKAPEPVAGHSHRLAELIARLNEASAEVDLVLSELAIVASAKENTVSKLEEDIETLREREENLQGRIRTLTDVPLPAVDHFAQLMAGNERRKARRDYLLFGAGVIVTTIIGIIIQTAIG